MEKIIIFLCCVAVSTTLAKPTSNEQLDKATANDVAVNTVVSADKKADIVNPSQAGADKKEGSTINITGVTTGTDPLLISYDKGPTTPFKPQRAGTMFARFIDDIFQIPISVLSSVARLITNPFTTQHKTPEAAVAAH